MKSVMKCALVIAFLFLYGCTTSEPTQTQEQDVLDKPHAFFKIYDATPNNSPVNDQFDLKGDLLAWTGSSWGQHYLYVRNLSSNQATNVSLESKVTDTIQVTTASALAFNWDFSDVNEARLIPWENFCHKTPEECAGHIKERKFVLFFNNETEEFEAYDSTSVPWGKTDKDVLKEEQHLFVLTYDKCVKPVANTNPFYRYGTCSEWDTFLKIYKPNLDKTFTIYGGRWKCADSYDCVLRSSDIYGDDISGYGDRILEGDVPDEPVNRLYRDYLHSFLDKDAKISTSSRFIARQDARRDYHIIVMEILEGKAEKLK